MDGIKEKVSRVREVVPAPSNNEIILVLQYYDYDVEKTIQAYLEDGAKEALQEWHYSGNKVANKKKKKNKPKPKPPVEGKTVAPPSDSLNQPDEAKISEKEEPPVLLNGHISEPTGTSASSALPHDVVRDKTMPASPSEDASVPSVEPAKPKQPVRPKHINVGKSSGQGGKSSGQGGHASSRNHAPNRERTVSEVSASSGISIDHHQKPYGGIERSLKDLQRQRTSLRSHSKKLKDEVDKSYKDMHAEFETLRKELNDREVELIFDMDKVKNQAFNTIKARQELGDDLKQKTYRASTMTDQELSQLRLDIKGFVSDRKIDEDLGSTTRFKCDTAEFLKHLKSFGEIVPVKGTYNQRHPSVSSLCSSTVSPEDLLSPVTPSPITPSAVFPPTPPECGTVRTGESKPLMSLDLKSDSLSTQELAELQQRLEDSLKLQGLPVSSGPAKRNTGAPKSANLAGNERNSARQNKDKNTAPPAYDSSDESKKSRSARRRQKVRERQREQRTNGHDIPDGKYDKKEASKPSSVPAKTSNPSGASYNKGQPSVQKTGYTGSGVQDRREPRKYPPRKGSESPSKRSNSNPRGDAPSGSRSPRRNRPNQRDGDNRREGQDSNRKPQKNEDGSTEKLNISKTAKNVSAEEVKNMNINMKEKEKEQERNKGMGDQVMKKSENANTMNGPIKPADSHPVKEEVKGTQTDPILNGDAEPYIHNSEINNTSNNNNNKSQLDKQRNDKITVSVKESMKGNPVTVSLSKIDHFQDHDSLPQRRPRGPRRNDRLRAEGDHINGNAVHREMNGVAE